jgi:hypothetical protein
MTERSNMTASEDSAPVAPAFAWLNKQTMRKEYRDWYSGAILDDYCGLFVSYGDEGQVLMRTWKDRETGERAFAAVRVL